VQLMLTLEELAAMDLHHPVINFHIPLQ